MCESRRYGYHFWYLDLGFHFRRFWYPPLDRRYSLFCGLNTIIGLWNGVWHYCPLWLQEFWRLTRLQENILCMIKRAQPPVFPARSQFWNQTSLTIQFNSPFLRSCKNPKLPDKFSWLAVPSQCTLPRRRISPIRNWPWPRGRVFYFPSLLLRHFATNLAERVCYYKWFQFACPPSLCCAYVDRIRPLSCCIAFLASTCASALLIPLLVNYCVRN